MKVLTSVCLQHSADQHFSLSGKSFHCLFLVPSTEDRGRAKQNKQDNDIPEGSEKDLLFPANAFHAFRRARKLLLVVGGVLPIALRVATVQYYNTIRPTPAHLHTF